MDTIYFNDTDGRKPEKLTNVSITDPITDLLMTLKQRLASLWNDDIGSIYIDQNISTHVAYVIDIVSKKHKSVSIYVDSHEVFWMKNNIENGSLSLDDMSYPNYAPRHQYLSRPHSVTIFDPEKELQITDDGSIPIIIYTHASRLTGQVFPLESIFKSIKEKYPNAVCIADGAQTVGGEKVYPLKYTDAYIVPTSKFIGAELHLGVCLLSDQFKNLYLMDNVIYPSVNIDIYKKELYSTNECLNGFVGIDFESHIREMRAYLLDEFLKVGLISYVFDVQDQASHIVTLSVGDKAVTESFVKSLEKNTIYLYHII